MVNKKQPSQVKLKVKVSSIKNSSIKPFNKEKYNKKQLNKKLIAGGILSLLGLSGLALQIYKKRKI